MKINWKVRLKNKTWLLAMAGVIIAFIYQIAGLLGLVPPVSEDEVKNLIGLIVNFLAALGIVVDPTTAGLGDSDRALGYDYPRDYLDEVYSDDRRSIDDLVETEVANYEDK